jgi:hypothetical protein
MEWNMEWSVETWRELVRPFCEKHSIDPVTVIPADANLISVEAIDAALAATREIG